MSKERAHSGRRKARGTEKCKVCLIDPFRRAEEVGKT